MFFMGQNTWLVKSGNIKFNIIPIFVSFNLKYKFHNTKYYNTKYLKLIDMYLENYVDICEIYNLITMLYTSIFVFFFRVMQINAN